MEGTEGVPNMPLRRSTRKRTLVHRETSPTPTITVAHRSRKPKAHHDASPSPLPQSPSPPENSASNIMDPGLRQWMEANFFNSLVDSFIRRGYINFRYICKIANDPEMKESVLPNSFFFCFFHHVLSDASHPQIDAEGFHRPTPRHPNVSQACVGRVERDRDSKLGL